MRSKYIDITFPINKDLPSWPGSIGYSSTFHLSIPKDSNNLSSINIDNHFGTHLDAPLHFIRGGKTVQELDLDKLIGRVYMAEVFGSKEIGKGQLNEADIPIDCKRLILKTDNQKLWERNNTVFYEDFCALSKDGAQWIVDRGIELIGIDYLSIQRFQDGPETHQILLEHEVVIVESLKLDEVSGGWYDLICLPIKLEGLEGAPARVLLKK